MVACSARRPPRLALRLCRHRCRPVTPAAQAPAGYLIRISPSNHSRQAGAACGARNGSVGNAPPDVPPGATEANDGAAPPPDSVLNMWRSAQVVVFDLDTAITSRCSLEAMAEQGGASAAGAGQGGGGQPAKPPLGAPTLALLRYLRGCQPQELEALLQAHPAASRLVPGAQQLVAALQARGVAIHLLSSGPLELAMPVAQHLSIGAECVSARQLLLPQGPQRQPGAAASSAGDERAQQPDASGSDSASPAARLDSSLQEEEDVESEVDFKASALAAIRARTPYGAVVLISGCAEDQQAAVRAGAGSVDLFVGYAGGGAREDAGSGDVCGGLAEWCVGQHGELLRQLRQHRVAMIGSGAWACAALMLAAANTRQAGPDQLFEPTIRMWVHEEDYQGEKLSDVINRRKENPRYLPGARLGDNIEAVPDLEAAVQGADVLIFCAPHQFMRGICKQLVGRVGPGAIAVSLTKGMRVTQEGPQLISEMVNRYLGIDCSVLMGANIAADIAQQQLSEAVIGYNRLENGRLLARLFETDAFLISLTPDVAGAEMCGTLKNVVALAAGMVDGLGYGPNTKAAILRQGLHEMRGLARALYPSVRDDTFLTSAGVADLVATCYGGRNRLVAEAWTRRQLEGRPATFEQLEAELLGGQKLQGVLTSDEVQAILVARCWQSHYPLFTAVNHIINGRHPPQVLVRYRQFGS